MRVCESSVVAGVANVRAEDCEECRKACEDRKDVGAGGRFSATGEFGSDTEGRLR